MFHQSLREQIPTSNLPDSRSYGSIVGVLETSGSKHSGSSVVRFVSSNTIALTGMRPIKDRGVSSGIQGPRRSSDHSVPVGNSYTK